MFHHGHGHHGHGDLDEELGKIYDSKVIARLPRFLAPVKGLLGVGTCGMVVRSLAALALPYLIATGTDRFILTGNVSGLNIIAILFIGAALLMWGGQYLETLFLQLAGQKILYSMRAELFEHLHQLSMSFFDRNKVGKLMSRVQNDVNQLQQFLTQGMLEIVTSVLTLAGIIVIMITMNARLALLTLTVLPVLAIMIAVWQKYARRAFSKTRKTIAAVSSELQEGISGVRVTQSLSREERSAEEFDDVNQANLSANISAVRLQALMMPVVQILTGIAFGLVLVIGGQQVLAGTMGVGVLLGFLLYIQRFFRPVMELIMVYTELQRSMASGSRIFELLDIEPEIQDSPQAIELSPVKGEIQFKHVNFAYEPGVEVLHDIDLTVNPGETVALVGRTGSGKSSMINLTARFYEVEDGEVTVDGNNVNSVTQQSLRSQIGIVPQDPFLFSGSIEENIRYAKMEASHEEVVEAAKTVGAHDFITRLEGGYEAQVGERGGNLSAGQRQLICLARVILADPRILVLDEATSNVDTNTERIMQEAVRRLAEGRTSLIIAHRLSTVASSDRIVALQEGRIVELGTHHELLAKSGIYAHMLEALNAPDLEQRSAG